MREEYLARITGPRYLMHAFQGNAEPSKKKGRNPTIEEDCEASLYRQPDRTIYVPSIQPWASMRNAAKNFKLRGRQSFWALINSALRIEPDEIPIEPQTFKPFMAGVVINNSRIWKARPMFENWSLKMKLVIGDERLTESTIKDILVEAGQTSGIGDWRPRFGTFEVASFTKA